MKLDKRVARTCERVSMACNGQPKSVVVCALAFVLSDLLSMDGEVASVAPSFGWRPEQAQAALIWLLDDLAEQAVTL